MAKRVRVQVFGSQATIIKDGLVQLGLIASQGDLDYSFGGDGMGGDMAANDKEGFECILFSSPGNAGLCRLALFDKNNAEVVDVHAKLKDGGGKIKFVTKVASASAMTAAGAAPDEVGYKKVYYVDDVTFSDGRIEIESDGKYSNAIRATAGLGYSYGSASNEQVSGAQPPYDQYAGGQGHLIISVPFKITLVDA